MITSESIQEIYQAIVRLQNDLPTLPKPAKTKYYDYTPLDVVINAIRLPLHEHGLSFVQFPTIPPVEYYPSIALTTRLMHISGQWIEDTMLMPIPEGINTNMAQNYGMGLTYARRYAITAILGLVSDEDVDAITEIKQQTNGQRKPVAKAKDIKPPMPTDAMKKKFHAVGSEFYGDEWDDKRPELCKSISKRREDGSVVTSSNDLYRAEMQELINGMGEKLAARKREEGE